MIPTTDLTRLKISAEQQQAENGYNYNTVLVLMRFTRARAMLKALSLKSGNLIWIWVLLINLLVNHCEIFFLSFWFYGSILTSRDFP